MTYRPLLTMEFECPQPIAGSSVTAGLYLLDQDGRRLVTLFDYIVEVNRHESYPTIAAKTFQRYVEAGDYSMLEENQRTTIEEIRSSGYGDIRPSGTRLLRDKILMNIDVMPIAD